MVILTGGVEVARGASSRQMLMPFGAVAVLGQKLHGVVGEQTRPFPLKMGQEQLASGETDKSQQNTSRKLSSL